MLQFLLIIAVFCVSTLLAFGIGRFSGYKWALGSVFGALILIIVNSPRLMPGLINTGFYQAILSYNIDTTLFGVAGIISIIPCLPRLRGVKTRYLVVTFLFISLLRSSLLPAACFFFNINELNGLSQRVDSNGVHLQTTGYTCGPAATATVLRAYGINDSEKNIALGTRCNSYSGTRSFDLIKYINSQYGEELEAEYRYIDRVDSLKDMNGFFIAEVKVSTFTDHFIAIMNFDGDFLTVADPSLGRFQTRAELFSREWRNRVIVVRRK